MHVQRCCLANQTNYVFAVLVIVAVPFSTGDVDVYERLRVFQVSTVNLVRSIYDKTLRFRNGKLPKLKLMLQVSSKKSFFVINILIYAMLCTCTCCADI